VQELAKKTGAGIRQILQTFSCITFQFVQTQINLLHCLGTCLFAKFQFSWHDGFGPKGES
jgi:hypothetical protein